MVSARTAEFYRVDIGGPHPATLGSLAFDGATKRNKPNLEVFQKRLRQREYGWVGWWVGEGWMDEMRGVNFDSCQIIIIHHRGFLVVFRRLKVSARRKNMENSNEFTYFSIAWIARLR